MTDSLNKRLFLQAQAQEAHANPPPDLMQLSLAFWGQLAATVAC